MSTDLFHRDSVRNTQSQLAAYISASRLNLWSRCPLALKLRYIDGIRTPTTPALFLGKVAHSGLECWYRHRQLGITLEPDEVARRLVASWGTAVDEEDMTFTSSTDEATLQRQAIDLVVAYLNYVPKGEPKPLAVEAAVEAPLVDPMTGEDLGIPLVGVMDLVLDGQEGAIVTDFKTSSRSSEPLEISHEIQLSCYSYLFRHGSQQREAGLEIRSLIKTKTPKVEFHPYPARNEEHFKRLFAVIRAYLDDLNAGRFVFRPGFGCSMCEQRETHCRAWSG